MSFVQEHPLIRNMGEYAEFLEMLNKNTQQEETRDE